MAPSSLPTASRVPSGDQRTTLSWVPPASNLRSNRVGAVPVLAAIVVPMLRQLRRRSNDEPAQRVRKLRELRVRERFPALEAIGERGADLLVRVLNEERAQAAGRERRWIFVRAPVGMGEKQHQRGRARASGQLGTGG